MQLELMTGLYGQNTSDVQIENNQVYDFKDYLRQKAIERRKETIRNIFKSEEGRELMNSIKTRIAHYIVSFKFVLFFHCFSRNSPESL
jgi:hypothetical protein